MNELRSQNNDTPGVLYYGAFLLNRLMYQYLLKYEVIHNPMNGTIQTAQDAYNYRQVKRNRNKTMKKELYTELLNHVIQTIEDQDLETFEDLHFHAFNEDYYIIGYYQAEQWLKEHDISAFDAIASIIDWETDTIGETTLNSDDMNPERIVNLYVYILGEELLSGFDLELSKEDLLSDLQEAL